jgi:hypothetical protein
MPNKRERQVIAHDIDSDGRYKQEHAHPKTPITMRTLPVRTRIMWNVFAIRYSVPVMTAFAFIHWFPLSGGQMGPDNCASLVSRLRSNAARKKRRSWEKLVAAMPLLEFRRGSSSLAPLASFW